MPDLNPKPSDLSYDDLEQSLGVKFKNRELLTRALTHPSYANEHGGADNQRLEFLGDAVFGLAEAERLFTHSQDHSEGAMSTVRSHTVDKASLADAAHRLGVEPYLRLGRMFVTQQKPTDAMLEDVLEALAGAIFIDCGYAAASQAVVRWLDFRYAKNKDQLLTAHAKNRLQEYLQSHGQAPPEYWLVRRNGDDHTPLFEAEVRHAGRRLATGTGGTKQTAETMAAEAGLAVLMDWRKTEKQKRANGKT